MHWTVFVLAPARYRPPPVSFGPASRLHGVRYTINNYYGNCHHLPSRPYLFETRARERSGKPGFDHCIVTYVAMAKVRDGTCTHANGFLPLRGTARLCGRCEPPAIAEPLLPCSLRGWSRRKYSCLPQCCPVPVPSSDRWRHMTTDDGLTRWYVCACMCVAAAKSGRGAAWCRSWRDSPLMNGICSQREGGGGDEPDRAARRRTTRAQDAELENRSVAWAVSDPYIRALEKDRQCDRPHVRTDEGGS